PWLLREAEPPSVVRGRRPEQPRPTRERSYDAKSRRQRRATDPIPGACVEDHSARSLVPSSAVELLGLPGRCQRRVLVAGNAIRSLPERVRSFVQFHGLPTIADVGAGTAPAGACGLRTGTAEGGE